MYNLYVRQMGRLIRLVHNRDLAVENIMTALVKQSAVLSSPSLRDEVLYEKLRSNTL